MSSPPTTLSDPATGHLTKVVLKYAELGVLTLRLSVMEKCGIKVHDNFTQQCTDVMLHCPQQQHKTKCTELILLNVNMNLVTFI